MLFFRVFLNGCVFIKALVLLLNEGIFLRAMVYFLEMFKIGEIVLEMMPLNWQ